MFIRIQKIYSQKIFIIFDQFNASMNESIKFLILPQIGWFVWYQCFQYLIYIYSLYFLGQILWQMKDHMHKIHQARIKLTSTAIPKKGTIHQPLNHFDKKNNKTFPQVQITDTSLHSSCSECEIIRVTQEQEICHFNSYI